MYLSYNEQVGCRVRMSPCADLNQAEVPVMATRHVAIMLSGRTRVSAFEGIQPRLGWGDGTARYLRIKH